MQAPRRNDPRLRRAVEGILFWGVCVLCTLPLFLARHLPFCDLPEHVAAIATLAHWSDPAWRSAEYFTVLEPWRTHYWLYHFVAAATATLVGSAERANLILLLVVAIGFPTSMRSLLRSLRRDERLAVVASAFFWNRALADGLLNYVASIPVTIFGLSCVVRHIENPTRKGAVGAALLGTAILFLHLSSFLIFVVGSCLLYLVLIPRADTHFIRAFARRARWLGVPVGIAAVTSAMSTLVHPDPAQGIHAGRIGFSSLSYRLEVLPKWICDFWNVPYENWASWVLWLVLALSFARWGRNRPSLDRKWLACVALWTFAIVLYFTMPSQVGFGFILEVRLAPYIALFFLLLIPPFESRIGNVYLAIATAASAAIGLVACREIRAFEKEEASHFEYVLRNLPHGKRLLTLVFDQRSEHAAISPFLHFGSYYRARYGGIASFSFSEVPHWPVQYRPEVAPPKKKSVFWDWSPCLFKNSIDGSYYDLILTRGDINPFANHPPGPKWVIIGGAKEWKLYQKTNDPVTEGSVDPGPCRRADGSPL